MDLKPRAPLFRLHAATATSCRASGVVLKSVFEAVKSCLYCLHRAFLGLVKTSFISSTDSICSKMHNFAHMRLSMAYSASLHQCRGIALTSQDCLGTLALQNGHQKHTTIRQCCSKVQHTWGQSYCKGAQALGFRTDLQAADDWEPAHKLWDEAVLHQICLLHLFQQVGHAGRLPRILKLGSACVETSQN